MPFKRAACVELRYRNLKGNGFKIICGDHNAHLPAWALPAFATAVDVPAAVHQHVREQDEISGKIDEEPLSSRFNSIHYASCQRRIFVDGDPWGVRRLKGDDLLSCQCAVQGACGAKDGIAFRHGY